MARAGAPWAVAKLDLAYLRKLQTFPFGKTFAAAIAGELIGEYPFLASGVAENDRAKLATIALIEADDLLAFGHRLRKQSIR